MSLVSFAARCPYCNHAFTVTVDAEKIIDKVSRVSCSNCDQACQIEGEGAYYLAPVTAPRKADPPVQPAQQTQQIYEQQFSNEDEEVTKYEAVPEDDSEDEPERDLTIFDALAFFSVVLTGIVLFSLLPVLLDNASLLDAYENSLRAFQGDIFDIGLAIIIGLVAGAIPTAIVVGITKLEISTAANLLGVCVLCFGAYGFVNSGAKDLTNSTWVIEGEEATAKFEIFENYAVMTFDATRDLDPQRQSFKPITNDSEAPLFRGKPAFEWGDTENDTRFYTNHKLYLINDKCLLIEGLESEEEPMDWCLVRQ